MYAVKPSAPTATISRKNVARRWRMVRSSWSGLAGLNRKRGRDGTAPEVEGDDDDHGIHEDGRYGRCGPCLQEDVPICRGHDNGDRPSHAPVRESEGLG